MPTWPTALPQVLLVDGFGDQPLDNAIAIDTESGEPMTRLRFTGDIEEIDGTVVLDGRDQLRILSDFWKYDLKRGTLRFTWDHPTEERGVEMLFRQAPHYSALGSDTFRADLRVWILP